MKTIKDSYELKQTVSDWVNQFNFIQVDVLNKVANDCLFEYIRPADLDLGEFIEYTNSWDEYEAWVKESDHEEDIEDSRDEWCNEQPGFDEWKYEHEHGENNYPMWNTCFEFKDDVQEDVIQAAMDAGFGIIEGLDEFNVILFVSGCGYSFYGAHWIPLFLNLPWNSDIKKQVEENKIEYSNL